MSYTQPNGQPQGVAAHFTNRLREILVAEITAINGYQRHIASSNIEEINKAWHSIMLDEKKHYGWLLLLLRKYDPEQSKQYQAHKGKMPGPKAPIRTQGTLYDTQSILNNIREDIKGEMEAVILYEPDLMKFKQKDIIATLRSIINEEKGHAEHLTKLLLKYDPDAYDSLT